MAIFNYEAKWTTSRGEVEREGSFETVSEAGQRHIEADIQIYLSQNDPDAAGLSPKEIAVRLVS